MKINKTPDSVCEKYSELGARISIRPLDEDYMLIEGPALDLEFLGEPLIARARYQEDCGFQISPAGPGQARTSGVTLRDFPRWGVVLRIGRGPCHPEASRR